MAEICQNTSNQVRHSLMLPLILIRLACSLKQIALKKMKSTYPSLATFGQRSGLKVIDVRPNFSVARQ